jgi:hypothetical protein
MAHSTLQHKRRGRLKIANVLNAAFQCDLEVYEKIKKIAERERRSIGQVINLMCEEQVKRRERWQVSPVYWRRL